VRFDLTTRASPDQVLRALTDFTERRLEIWSKTLDPTMHRMIARLWRQALDRYADAEAG